MINRSSLLLLAAVILVAGTLPGIAAAEDPNFDPARVDIVSIDGQSPDQVNEIQVNITDPLTIELGGLDETDRPLHVEIGGEVVSSMNESEASLRPRSGSAVTTGQQTLQIVYEDRGDRTIVAETEVDVTEVTLDRPDADEGLGFDPETVEIEAINGQDPSDVPQLELTATDSIAIELDGADATDVYARVELDGIHIGSTTKGDSEFRPHTSREVSTGTQSFTLVRERDGERIVIDEVDVEVTRVDLGREDSADLTFDPAAVSIESVDGQSPGSIELALSYSESVVITLEGIDVTNHAFEVNLSGTTIGSIGESEGEFRPRSDSQIEPGDHTLTIRKRVSGHDDPVVAETSVTITSVNLDRDADRNGVDVKPADVSLVSVAGNPAEGTVELELSKESPLSIEIDGAEIPDRGFQVEIGGSVIGIMQTHAASIRPRQGVGVSTGDQSLDIVWDHAGNRTVLASTPVRVTAVDLDRERRSEDPTTVDLEIVSVNGQPASGTVVTEYDLRGETPITMTVSGLNDTELEPAIRYQGETLSTNIDGYEIDGNRLSMSHLPRISDGEAATLELVQWIGAEEVHVYDSVRIEYRQVDGKTELPGDTPAGDSEANAGSGESSGQEDGADGQDEQPPDSDQAESAAEDSGGGILGGLVDALTGGGDEAADTGQAGTTTTETGDGDTQKSTTTDSADGEGGSDKDGGIFSFFRDLFGF